MAGSDRRHAGGPTRRRRWWLALPLVVVLLGGAAAAYRLDVWDRWFAETPPDPATQPAEVPAPEGLELPPLRDPAPVAAPLHQGAPTTRADVRRAIAAPLRDKDLGRDVHALVVDLDSGRTLFDTGGGPATPASTMKLLTSTAALQLLGPDHRFRTTVVRHGRRVTLVGGGDPLLARKADQDAWPHQADLGTLARKAARALRADGVRRIRLGYDATLFPGPAASPAWEPDYLRDGVVSPISALWVDEGREAASYARVADPAATAATEFAADLRRAGITVTGKVGPQHATGRQVAVVDSPPLGQLVEHTLSLSDNEAAEVLARQVGVAAGTGGSFGGAVAGITRTLEDLGVDLDGARLHDGSGLARSDRLDPQTLVDVLRVAADRDRLRAVLTGLPVAGFTGSLTYRFEDVPEAGVGRVRAKTGTLTGVSALAGLVQTSHGRELAFVVNADRVRLIHTLDARDALDRIAARLAAAA